MKTDLLIADIIGNFMLTKWLRSIILAYFNTDIRKLFYPKRFVTQQTPNKYCTFIYDLLLLISIFHRFNLAINYILYYFCRMYNRSPLSTDQIQQLRQELTKILEANMSTFDDRLASFSLPSTSYDLDSLFLFSQQEYDRLRNLLENISHFTFNVLNNFELVWQEVFDRDTKITQLRQTFSSATSYLQELRIQNDQIKQKLGEAETYIEWIQQQKQYLDAIYYDDNTSSLTIPSSRDYQMAKCASENSLKWSQNRKKKNLNYQRLRDYIQNIKQQRNQLERELITLNKRYQLKSQQCKQSNLLIEHLVDRLNKRNQLKEYIDIINNSITPNKQDRQNELSSAYFLQILQKNQNISSATSLPKHLDADQQNRKIKDFCHNFGSFSQLHDINDPTFREFNRSQHNFSGFLNRQTKDVQICTESQLLRCQAVQTQTEDKQNTSKQQKFEYKISIEITGQDKNKKMDLQKIIKDMHIQKQIKSKLNRDQRKKAESKNNQNIVKREDGKISSLIDYYHRRWISNRIKKYTFLRPDTKIVHKCLKVN